MAILLWSLLVTAGVGMLVRHSQQPGEVSAVPHEWPARSQLPVAPQQRTLVMFVHPHCPCSRASLSEMAQIVGHHEESLQIIAVFVRPDGMEPGWEQGQNWKHAGKIPGVYRQVDPSGREAELFGARTSGHVFVFDENGRRQFSGGITAFRGHMGDNPGRRAVDATVHGRLASRPTHCVYGCPLVNLTFAVTESPLGVEQ